MLSASIAKAPMSVGAGLATKEMASAAFRMVHVKVEFAIQMPIVFESFQRHDDNASAEMVGKGTGLVVLTSTNVSHPVTLTVTQRLSALIQKDLMNATASRVTLVMVLTAHLMVRVMESTAILMLTVRRVLIFHVNAYAE